MIVIKELFADVINNLSPKPNYFFGDWLQISNDLLAKGSSRALGATLYPVILLHSDFKEDNSDKIPSIDPIIYIINKTGSTNLINNDERFEKTFKPILYPIADKLIFELQHNKYFFHGFRVQFEKKDYFLQNLNTNVNDRFDAVELKFKKLYLNKTTIKNL